jgi:hypothetical protein
VGALAVTNSSTLSIGQVTAGGSTYSGINATGAVSITTSNGNLAVSQNVATTSTAATPSAPALKLSAGDGTAAGTISGGDVVLSGAPTISVGTGGIAEIYSGSTLASTGVASTFAAKSPNYLLYNKSSASLPASGAGYYVFYREPGVPIYLLPASGQSSTYGTAPLLNYWYSSSPNAVVPCRTRAFHRLRRAFR